MGCDVPIPLFTLILIRDGEEPVDVGTLHFMFAYYYNENGEEDDVNTIKIEYVFKRSKFFDDDEDDDDEKKGIWVEPKDILNIRTEFSTIPLSKYRTKYHVPNYKIDDINTEFYTYLTTILIELDPL